MTNIRLTLRLQGNCCCSKLEVTTNSNRIKWTNITSMHVISFWIQSFRFLLVRWSEYRLSTTIERGTTSTIHWSKNRFLNFNIFGLIFNIKTSFFNPTCCLRLSMSTTWNNTFKTRTCQPMMLSQNYCLNIIEILVTKAISAYEHDKIHLKMSVSINFIEPYLYASSQMFSNSAYLCREIR